MWRTTKQDRQRSQKRRIISALWVWTNGLPPLTSCCSPPAFIVRQTINKNGEGKSSSLLCTWIFWGHDTKFLPSNYVDRLRLHFGVFIIVDVTFLHCRHFITILFVLFITLSWFLIKKLLLWCSYCSSTGTLKQVGSLFPLVCRIFPSHEVSRPAFELFLLTGISAVSCQPALRSYVCYICALPPVLLIWLRLLVYCCPSFLFLVCPQWTPYRLEQKEVVSKQT